MFFFFNDTATTEIYTLSLHDALPISVRPDALRPVRVLARVDAERPADRARRPADGLGYPEDGCQRDGEGHRDHRSRSEEHTSELQSRQYLVCRLLLEKKNKKNTYHYR